MEIRMPENAKKVIETLEAAGYEAYIVGGCVRDSILGREPGDWAGEPCVKAGIDQQYRGSK